MECDSLSNRSIALVKHYDAHDSMTFLVNSAEWNSIKILFVVTLSF